MAFSSGSASFARPVFRNLWGVPPWTDSAFSWGTLGFDFVDFLEDSDGKFAPNIKKQSNNANLIDVISLLF